MEIPRVGYGTYQSSDSEKLKAALKHAIEEVGVRHIDCAKLYGNQSIIGETLKEIFAKGKVKREDLWITSKLWNTKHRPDLVEAACRQTLAELQLDYLDLYLMHWPVAFESRDDDEGFPTGPNGLVKTEKIDVVDTWKAMEKLVEKGLAKKIGVSNFSIETLERMRYHPDIKIQPYVNQVELHVYLQQPYMIHYLESRGMHITAYACAGRAVSPGPLGYSVMQDPVLNEVAQQVGKTPVQVALRYLLHLSPCVSIIPKSVTPNRIKENFELDFELSQEQIDKIKSLDRAFRFVDPSSGWGVDALSLGHGF